MAEIQISQVEKQLFEVRFTHPVALSPNLLVRFDCLDLDLLTISGENCILAVQGSFETILDFLSSGPFKKEIVQEFLSAIPDGEGI